MTATAPQTEPIFSPDDLIDLNLNQIPGHIAIIPDGNRRWAKGQSLDFCKGHRQGADNLLEILKAAKELGVKALTFYTFSTENWSRSQKEVEALMYLLQLYLVEQREAMLEHGVRLRTIGDLSKLPNEVCAKVIETKEITAHCQDMEMILAVNYGGRDEIRRAFTSIIDDYDNKKITKDQITENLISGYLDTCHWKDPELLIRTSGELRVSNFLLWQISYAEVYVADVLWPDFSPLHLRDAIFSYQNRERRLGGP